MIHLEQDRLRQIEVREEARDVFLAEGTPVLEGMCPYWGCKTMREKGLGYTPCNNYGEGCDDKAEKDNGVLN